MDGIYLWGYILIVPILCLIVGYIIGKKHGWHLRDNMERNDQVKKAKEYLNVLTGHWNKLHNELHQLEFNLIKIKKRKDAPLTLEEQLKKAIEDENYELASEIQNKINKLNNTEDE